MASLPTSESGSHSSCASELDALESEEGGDEFQSDELNYVEFNELDEFEVIYL